MDKYDLQKMKKSRSMLKKLKKEMQGVISTQILQEFYVAATKKLNADPIIVKDIIRSFENFEIVTITPPLSLSHQLKIFALPTQMFSIQTLPT